MPYTAGFSKFEFMRDSHSKLLVPVAVLFAAFAPAAFVALDGEGVLQLDKLAGGDLTSVDTSEHAYQQPAPTLTSRELKLFAEGREGFVQHWVVAPSVLGLWGRGPTSNAGSVHRLPRERRARDATTRGGRSAAVDASTAEYAGRRGARRTGAGSELR